MSFSRELFLPVNRQDLVARGWEDYDFLIITGDAYVDHPTFGHAIIGRLLESKGYRVAIMAQPDWKDPKSFTRFGRPRLGVLIAAGNLDSMVAHYTVSKKRRHTDAYSPGRKGGLRPDRATIVYSNCIRQVYGDIPIVIGGLEASLRRFAHYDYWENKVRRSILLDSQADILTYGMGENATLEIAERLKAGTPVYQITDVRGTCVIASNPGVCAYKMIECPSYEEVASDKRKYAEANMIEYEEHDPIRGKAVLQKHGNQYLIVNPPSMPLTTPQMDYVAELPYVREPHPDYDKEGGVPAIEEVRFSVAHNRGCFGACNFCSLAFHQGRMISIRSEESVIREVTMLTKHPGFKGYIHDVGGPTANFRHLSCKKQAKHGMCKNRNCLAPHACENLDADHSAYLELLRKLRAIPGIKKIFIRSGIRFDYCNADKNGTFMRELTEHHISGQLKVAPEHVVNSVLDYMGKPHIEEYEKFKKKYEQQNKKLGKEQYLVPYLMSSHPGCTLEDAVKLGEWLSLSGHMPEQVQDFYPTPGTLSTCMWYTGIDPRTMDPVFVPKTATEKAMQRALMQWRLPENRNLVRTALYKTGRTDLIGFKPGCLLRPGSSQNGGNKQGSDFRNGKTGDSKKAAGKGAPSKQGKGGRPEKGKGAKPAAGRNSAANAKKGAKPTAKVPSYMKSNKKKGRSR